MISAVNCNCGGQTLTNTAHWLSNTFRKISQLLPDNNNNIINEGSKGTKRNRKGFILGYSSFYSRPQQRSDVEIRFVQITTCIRYAEDECNMIYNSLVYLGVWAHLTAICPYVPTFLEGWWWFSLSGSEISSEWINKFIHEMVFFLLEKVINAFSYA